MDLKERLIDAFHKEALEKGSSHFTYTEIIEIIKNTKDCNGCMGASFGDCEDCK